MDDVRIPLLAQTRIIPLTRIRRERTLPVRCEVSVMVGKRVEPLDVIARAPGQVHLRPVPLARYLHLAETALPRYLLKQPGEQFVAREVIASKPELFGTLRRLYRAPASGRVAALQGVWLTMELIGEPLELPALYRGVVVHVMPGRGAIIEASGTLVQCAWGTGGEAYGVLKKAVDESEDILEDDSQIGTPGAVLVAGAGITEQALRHASEEHVAGIIVGGLEPGLGELAKSLGLPVIATEGLGRHPMAAPIFEVLASHVGEQASIETSLRARGGAIRPEIFIPVTAKGAVAEPPPVAVLTAEVGAHVRILRAPYEGKLGRIAGIPKIPQLLESGVSAWGALIELEQSGQAFVPWQNIELID